MLQQWWDKLNTPVDAIPLVIFRIAFGVLMFFSTLRFILRGWVTDFYIEPIYHFTYLGFSWIQPISPTLMMGVFIGMLVLSVCILFGMAYRFSIVLFFICFTYIELLDKAYYLNHYYFISILSLLMICLPLNIFASVDAWLHPEWQSNHVPRWTIDAPRLLLGIVYFYAGLAKVSEDWLFHALPLGIWLPTKTDLPLIGWLFDFRWVAYGMSWGGAIYDLTIPFALVWRRTRLLAYVAVMIFHFLTAILFNIGVFPWVMIASTLIFFEGEEWRGLFNRFRHLSLFEVQTNQLVKYHPESIKVAVVIFFIWQLLMPLRHWLGSDNHLWSNQGFRFAWHVMVVEKTGTVIYRIQDPTQPKRFWIVYPSAYLTRQQEHQMSFQPDMIVQFAHYLDSLYREECGCDPIVYADTYVSLNRREGQPILPYDLDLSTVDLWKLGQLYQNTGVPDT